MQPRTETHIAIWGAWYGSRNVGDRALLLTIAPMLKTVFSNVRISIFTDKPDIVREYAPQEPGLIVEAFENKRQFHRLVHTLAVCDLFIIGGGVPFYDQTYHLWVMRWLVSIARLFKTPYMTWAVASQKVESKVAKRVFKWILDGAAGVTFRDRPTGQMFRECGTTRPMTLVADPAFTLSIDESGAGEEAIRQAIGSRVHARPLAALVCRRMRHDHSYSSDHYNAKTPEMVDRAIECFASALDWMWESGYQPIMVPMNTVEPDDDREMGKLVIQAAKHGGDARSIHQAIEPVVAAAVFRQCRLGMSSRVHATVLATVANCEVDPKTWTA